MRILGNGTSILSSYIISPIVPQLLSTLLHVHGSLIANSIEDTNDTLKSQIDVKIHVSYKYMLNCETLLSVHFCHVSKFTAIWKSIVHVMHYRFLVLVVNFEMQPLLLLLHKNVLGVLSFEIFVFHFFMLIIQQF